MFLLSLDEIETYFSSDADEICYPTAYAKAQGASVMSGYGCAWWTRDVNTFNRDSTPSITQVGGYATGADIVNWTGRGVRPAMWITLAD